jgi:hypothetical protein
MAGETSVSSQCEKLIRKNDTAIRAYTRIAQYKAEIARLNAMSDSAIDYSDISPLTDEQLARLVHARLRPRKRR